MTSILITGGAGFIGSHLAKRLISENFQVSIIDNLSTGSLTNLEGIIDSVRFVQGDILDINLLEELIVKNDVIFHMAAAVGVKNIIENPIGSLETNYTGSENLLTLSSKHNKRVFIASTSEIYGKNPNQPLREDFDRLVGAPQKLRWTYADAKALEESLAYALFLRDGLKVTTLRFFNTVGPNQTGMYGMVIPRFVKSAKSNQPLEIYGDGSQTRVFCHVQDVVDALIILQSKDETIGQVYNIGGIGEISILELANKILELTNSKSKIIYRDYSDVYPPTFEDMLRRVPDISKIKNAINWSPSRDLNQIINDVSLSFS